MFLSPDGILLKDSLELYNNLGIVGDAHGRLTVAFEFAPSPLLKWDFEVIDGSPCSLRAGDGFQVPIQVSGVGIELSNAFITGNGFSAYYDNYRNWLSGFAGGAVLGGPVRSARYVSFYLPNPRFHVESRIGQYLLAGGRVRQDGEVVSDKDEVGPHNSVEQVSV